MFNYAAIRQLIRYGIVGVLNNLLGYSIYLAITFFGLDPKLTISLLYPIGATTAYFGHSRYSFAYDKKGIAGPLRYIIAHAISYGANLLMLYVFWQRAGLPHQLVQGAAIFVCAGILFVLFKYFVFASGGPKPA